MKKYQIELNENQILILERALDIMVRLGLKQYDIVAENIETDSKMGLSWDQRQAIKKVVREIEGFDIPLNASHSINGCLGFLATEI